MKKTVILFVVTAVSILLLDFYTAYYLNDLYQKNDSNKFHGSLNYVLNHETFDTLCLGSSRMMHNIQAPLLGPSCFILAEPSMKIGYQAAVLSILEAQNKLPNKMVILEINPSVYCGEYNEYLRSQIHHLKYYYFDSPFIKNEINQHSTLEFLKYYSNLYRFNGISSQLIESHFRKNIDTFDLQGYVPLFGNKSNLTTLYDPKLISNELNQSFEVYLKVIKNICLENNLKLVTVHIPQFGNSKYEFKWSALTDSLMTKMDLNYVDLGLINKDIQLDSLNWNDEIHLNQLGSQKLSELLISTLKKENN